MAGPAVYLGRQGSTGDSTGEHFHFTLKNKKGQTIPFSTARTDVGQYLQYRLPGSEEWVNLYKKNPAGGFTSAPYMQAPTGGSAYGMRESHPIHGDRRMHYGEDYPLPKGAQLRFLGQGSVSTHAGRGGAGNVSVLRLPSGYELETYHLSELPQAATTRPSDTVETAGAPTDSRTDDILKAFMYGTQLQNKKEEVAGPSLQDTLKGQIVGGLLSQALNPMGFLDSYRGGNPFLSGKTAATSDYLGGLFG
jgi:murein DD-endopeptidase MepM/ murein hydrolase activator NlpD